MQKCQYCIVIFVYYEKSFLKSSKTFSDIFEDFDQFCVHSPVTLCVIKTEDRLNTIHRSFTRLKVLSSEITVLVRYNIHRILINTIEKST